MHKWTSHVDAGGDRNAVDQIVILRQNVLSLAHDHQWSGHLGITKTYDRILQHFFWQGLAQFCQTCYTCQITGKPNQVIPPAPLCPIPVIGEPFKHVVVVVGPLPKTKSGNQFLLTIMCMATRYSEAIPLQRITSPVVSKALIKFFTTFGLPKVVQSDQGTNILSKLFKQVLKSLSITHRVASAYHPESQGALEGWHQTLKSMLRKYCLESEKDWDEGVPLVLFAACETVQESLGFSPTELVFGHTVRGPIKVLKEQFLSQELCTGDENVLDYVSRFRERLHQACALAKEALSSSQRSMKGHYDKQAVSHPLQPGDQVLVLLPVPGSSLVGLFLWSLFH
uniref:Gypsy retrotransposon integrase-like protein 1 n=1 Tax=Oncorhynchus tshawytscha TaxID=74940 RepID=A0AAZ3NMD4_ONCTS